MRLWCGWLATLVAEMLLSKDQYTDGYALNGDTAHLAVIDPVGHDLTASVLAAVTVGRYRHCRRAGLDLAATHAALDQTIATQFGGERFVTGQLGQLDCGTGRLQWINAGHPLPLLVRGAKVVDTLACHPVPPLGLGLGRPEIATADLVVRETLAGQPAAETMRRLAHAILAHQGTSPRDDATMVFLEWPGPPGELA